MGVTQVIIGVPKEICPGEERVALTPANVGALLKKNGVEIRIERGAGEAAGFTDGDYENAGAKLTDRDDIFSNAQAILQVQTPGSNTTNGQEDLDKLKAGQFLIGMTDPLELTGLYDGIPMTEKSVWDMAERPDTVWLYREPILAEWRDRGDVTLDQLIAHVVVHEFAHHFGWSDDDIAEIDPWWE